MIIKASQRGGAKQLALHLMSGENEHVRIHEVSGASAENIQGALHEMYAVSKATKCKKFLLSVSLNPPEDQAVPAKVFEDALTRIEKELKLEGQPRCVVFHEKEGRRHAHCVWSRIDTDSMKAIKLDYYKKRLNGIAKELFLENGWELPKGFDDARLRNPHNFTLEEWQQAKCARIKPQMLKARLQQCWKQSDSKAAFVNAIAEAGFFLARGDRRGFVVMGWQGEIYSLTKATGQKTKILEAKLGKPDTLPSVEDIHAKIKAQENELHARLKRELELKHKTQSAPLKAKLRDLVRQQRAERKDLNEKQAQRNITDAKARQANIRTGLRGLWDWLTGAKRKQKQRNDELAHLAKERDQQEWEALVSKQLKERQAIQQQIKHTRTAQQQERFKLNASFTKDAQGIKSTPTITQNFNQHIHQP